MQDKEFPLRFSGDLWRRFIVGWGVLVAFFAVSLAHAADTVTFFHNDASGTPMLATDANGNVVWKETYRPYGERIVESTAAASNKIGFTGKPYDASTGLSYMEARYYDPTIGRFMGVDPAPVDLGNLHSPNRYAYANNNPHKFVDPDGRTPLDVAFLAYDLGKLGVSLWTGVGVGSATVDVAWSAVGVFSPVPGAGQAIKAARAIDRTADAGKAADNVRSTRELRGGDFLSSRSESIKNAGGKCEYCGKDGGNQGDHAKTLNTYKKEINEGRISKAQAKAEANSPANIVASCKQCNEVDKHTKDLGTGAGQYNPPRPSDRVNEMLRR